MSTNEEIAATIKQLDAESKHHVTLHPAPIGTPEPGKKLEWAAVIKVDDVLFVAAADGREDAERLVTLASEALGEMQAMAVRLNKLHPITDEEVTAATVGTDSPIKS